MLFWFWGFGVFRMAEDDFFSVLQQKLANCNFSLLTLTSCSERNLRVAEVSILQSSSVLPVRSSLLPLRILKGFWSVHLFIL